MSARNGGHHGNIFFDRGFGAGELEEEGGQFFPLSGGCGFRQIDDFHLDLVHDFHGGDLDARAHDACGCCCRISDGGEGDDRDRVFRRHDGELEGDFCDEAEGSFGAYEETVEVVACGGFAGSAFGLDDGSVREDNG